MSYVGSTAASSVANPPKRIDSGVLAMRSIRESTSVNEGGGVWSYNSTNTKANLQTTGFISDAGNIGMRNGDILMSVCWTTEASSGHTLVIGIVKFDSTSAASLSTNGTISSTAA